jgi:hypothetical protein
MKNVFVAVIAILAVAGFSSCKKVRCVADYQTTLADSTTSRQHYEWESYDCNQPYSVNGQCVNCGQNGGGYYDPNQNGGVPSTGGAPGTYTNPITDLSVVHEGQYDVIITDPGLASLRDYTSSRLLLPDINQNGSIDLELFAPANHYGHTIGVIYVNGYYYQVEPVVDVNNWGYGGAYGPSKVTVGTKIPNALTISNKAYGYSGNPNNPEKNSDGTFFISPAAKRYYSIIQ